MKQPNKFVQTVIHVIAWVCFFLLPYIFSAQPKEQNPVLSQHIFTLSVSINIFLLIFYYVNTLVLIPKLLFNKKLLWYILTISIFFISFLYVPRAITFRVNGTNEAFIREQFKADYLNRNKVDTATNLPDGKNEIKPKAQKKKQNIAFKYFPGSFVVFLLILTIGICVTLVQQWQQAEHKRTLVEHEKINTELSFLKSQVNPHFFFNTLNNIYSLAVVQSDKTPGAILKLSSIMRYVLTEAEAEKVELQNEIDFINNYIELQKVRLTDKVAITFTKPTIIQHQTVAPLLFITFVENAFKYGVSTKDQTFIDIDLQVTGNTLTFKVSNKIVANENTITDNTGIGINNVKRRLALSYPEKHTLTVTKEDQIFNVQLVLNLA